MTEKLPLNCKNGSFSFFLKKIWGCSGLMNSFSISEIEKQSSEMQREKKVIVPSSTFGILRQNLVKNLGHDRIRDVLFHMGYDMGVVDGQGLQNKEYTQEDLVKYGPVLHMENGHISGIKHDCEVKMDDEGKVISVIGQGVWFDSYEAREHLQWVGKSDKPVCHTLLGYASGYMSTVFNEKLIAKELTCVGKGDKECSWIIKTQRQWEIETPYGNEVFQDIPIIDELRYTYDQLVNREKMITSLLSFQQLLTTEVAQGNNLYQILEKANELLNKPIIVNSIKSSTVTYVGLSEKKYLKIENDFKNFIAKSPFDDLYYQPYNKQVLPKIRFFETNSHKRIMAPVFVQKELAGWCSLIYEYSDVNDNDHLFLDRLSNTVSLLLLNEKTKFESFERMKGNFFEQILSGNYSKKEIISRGLFAGVDLTKSYYIAIVDFQPSNQTIEESFIIQEQIYESTYTYFNERKQNVLVGHRDGKITLYLPDEYVKNTIEDVLKEYCQYLEKTYLQGTIKVGISNNHQDIEEVKQCHQEAAIALKLALKKQMATYSSLGIIGVLMDSNNMEMIKYIAKQQLQSLYDEKNPKSVELLKTLYVFLSNGGNLEQTKADLALSMSGLRHRIHKIETILNKDLRNPEEMYQLLLIIKVLIVAEEVQIE